MGRFEYSTEIFDNERVLNDDWSPESLPEREDELGEIERAFAPAVRDPDGGQIRNVFVYGKTGQGKTVGVDTIINDLEEEVADEIDATVIKYSCAKDSSSYTVACNLVSKLTGSDPNGYSNKKVFDKLYDAIEDIGGRVIFVLDEIDAIGTGDKDLLYEFPRARSNGHLQDAHVSLIGISNDFNFHENLPPKVKDTIFECEVHFTPYDATDLQDIIRRRAEKAFQDDVVLEEVIQLVAAFSAQDKGSARQAIQYLYEAGEIASKEGVERITEEHVRQAEYEIDRRAIMHGIRNLTTQDKLALVALVCVEVQGDAPAKTRQVYSKYIDICDQIDADKIAQRRVRDHLRDLAMTGIAELNERNSGVQGGKHYTWRLQSDLGTTIDVLEENNRFEGVIAGQTTSSEQSTLH